MEKKRLAGSLFVMILLGVSGCAGYNRTDVMNQNNVSRPIGYYSNENHQNKTSGLFSDNDGPIIELMDHTLGAESDIAARQKRASLQTRDENGNPPNPTAPLAAEDQFLNKDNRFSTSDANYHNQLNQNINNTGFSTDHKALARISEKLRRKVSGTANVRDVRSVIYGSSVLIAVDLIDKSKADTTKKEIQKAVKPYVNGKAVTIITDEGSFSRDRNNQSGVRAER